MMAGYHNMPSETEQILRNGWLYTGDIARMDQDGYFYLVDRKKELIKPGGFQVWPREVEEVLARHPMVAEAAVAGVLHPQRGELVAAWIVLQPEHAPSADASPGAVLAHHARLREELRIFCQVSLAAYKIPTVIEFVQALPRSSVGKVLRRELVRQYSFNRGHDSTI
jgi:long-chain acyl-CoA synthetase